jgi:integrase
VLNYTDASGKRRLKSFKRKIDAQRYETQVKVELARGNHVPARQSITVSEAADNWYRACEGRQLRRTTLEQYEGEKKKIVARLGGIKLNELTEAKVLDFRDKIATEDWKDKNGTVWPGTQKEAKKVFWTLGAILNDAKARGLVGQNVVYNVMEAQRGKGDRRKVSQKRKLVVDIDYPTPDEVRRILAQLKDDLAQWHTLILTMAFTGMRIGEIRALPRSNVEVMKPPYQLHVRQSADARKTIDVPKSTAGDRSIDLIPTLVGALREHLLKTPKTALDLVFPTPRGGVLDEDTINAALKEAQLRAGVVNAHGEHKYTAHKLRHFFAWVNSCRARATLPRWRASRPPCWPIQACLLMLSPRKLVLAKHQ